MDADAAHKLVVDEGLGEEGIVLLTRIGEDPGPQRMDQVVQALRVLTEHLKGEEKIDRRLAHAAYCLASDVERTIDSWMADGQKWRERLVQYELTALLAAVESLLGGSSGD